MLGQKLNIPLPSQKPKVVGQRSRFVLSEEVLDANIVHADITLQIEQYGVPGLSDYRKNIVLVTSPLAAKCGVASYKNIINFQDGDSSTAQQIKQTIMSIIRLVHEGQQRAKSMDWMDI